MSTKPYIHLLLLDNREIIANDEKTGTLEIMADYYFSVPLGLNRETGENILEPSRAVSYELLTNLPRIQGKITLKIQVNVIHDIESIHKKEAAYSDIRNNFCAGK